MLELNQGRWVQIQQFWGIIWTLIRGLTQKYEGTNVGAGSLWPQLWAYVNISGFMGWK